MELGNAEARQIVDSTVEVERLCRLKGFVGVWGDWEGLMGAPPQGVNHLSHLDHTSYGLD